MPLQLEHLQHAIEALSELVSVAENEERMSQLAEVERAGIIAGVIKNFEIAYELSWKLTARWINENVSPGVADGVTRRELFRLAAQNRLIADVDLWMQHHRARNQTAHIYDREQALRVYQATRVFVRDARDLLAALEARND